jgi:hypothetical protein
MGENPWMELSETIFPTDVLFELPIFRPWKLLEFAIFPLRLFENRDVGVSVPPQRKEILVGSHR